MAVLTDEDVIKRVESPLNLLQRLRGSTSRPSKESLIVSIPAPKSEQIIPDLDDKLAITGSRTRALSVMNKALGRLDDEIGNLRVDRLPGVIGQMATAIKAIEPDNKDKNLNPVQFIVYSPTMMKESDYGEVIEVKE